MAITLALIAALAGCEREPPVQHHTFFALGTVIQVSLHAPLHDSDKALHDLESLLLAEENRWRAWDTGELAGINRDLSEGRSVEVPPEAAAVLRRARNLSERSGERFNPAIGRLVELWGFHQEDRPSSPPPDAARLESLLPSPSLDSLVEAEDGTWHSEDSRLWLDMGGFAKGIALEAARALLVEHGIERAIVNAGGDLITLGHPAERDWRIGIRDPRGAGMLAILDVNGSDSVFTSGDYERAFEWEGEKFHHILDPATGMPAPDAMSVTVLHPDAALADAAVTALFVAGERWPEIASALEVEHVMVVRRDGRIQVTPSMHRRVTFETTDYRVETLAP